MCPRVLRQRDHQQPDPDQVNGVAGDDRRAHRGLPRARLQSSPRRDEWSPNDVLAHLRSCSDMWGRYIAKIIAEDRPTIRAMSPRTWIKSTNYPELEFASSLRAFRKQRAELLALLTPLPKASWSRRATV